MGAVYKARDIHLGRSVAVKVLPGESVATPERKRRFALEARAASALNHPNIVTVYDIDEADGVDFIAMEYVAGQTLAELIPPGGMDPAMAVRLGREIADALAAAHSSGIVHRDSAAEERRSSPVASRLGRSGARSPARSWLGVDTNHWPPSSV
jgi:serine/threonine-protein kinase